jgi:hypothetical protein
VTCEGWFNVPTPVPFFDLKWIQNTQMISDAFSEDWKITVGNLTRSGPERPNSIKSKDLIPEVGKTTVGNGQD